MSLLKPSLFFILLKRLQKKSFLYEFYFKNKQTLDIGCGEGEFLNNDPENIYGVDLNKTAIGRLLNKGCKVKLGDITKLDYESNYFEAVHCSNVIEHLNVEEALQMIKEGARVLKKAGIFVLASEMPTRFFLDTFGHIKPYPPKAIKKLLRENSYEAFEGVDNLEYLTEFYIGNYHKNPILYACSFILGFYLPFFRREYFVILRKK
ncbi:MAG: hypothetical protein US42_C0004G0035 [Candidatus Magasanikbacteria bacterium GW2011_GWC2_37_14]|uniref:Methyltransferase type 11 domain-containing protein n=1 Tax=Candidatus Magasanikbacteria bacterium GW2011_GWC2_37_14 TaxID=1619046 RepID=A0A0G0JII9_9BACT|nr:MAG: hypothetical protein US42_C0004G0035 [Candidatus Magasanikbacteria bacterium GW2011_GWC2_37_14]